MPRNTHAHTVEENSRRTGENIDRILPLIERQASAIEGLAAVAQAHESRIERLEGR